MEEITIVSCSLVRDMKLPLNNFIEQLEITINSLCKNISLIAFPEYCWRLTPIDEVLSYVNTLKDKIPSNLTIVLGTTEFVLNDKYTNNSIVIHNKNITFVPKTKILKSERDRGLVPGINPGVIEINSANIIYKLGVLVCADLWEPSLLLSMAKQNVDIIVVPAWTLTLKGKEQGSRAIWHALTKATAAQYGIVVAVADHAVPLSDSKNPSNSIGNVTVIFTPDNREKPNPIADIIKEDVEVINLSKVRNERDRWREKGLLPLNI